MADPNKLSPQLQAQLQAMENANQRRLQVLGAQQQQQMAAKQQQLARDSINNGSTDDSLPALPQIDGGDWGPSQFQSPPAQPHFQQQGQQQAMMDARQRKFQMMVTQQQQHARSSDNGNVDGNIPSQPLSKTMGIVCNHYFLDDFYCLDQKPEFYRAFDSACRSPDGPLSTVQSIVSSETLPATFLHRGLALALRAGNMDIARYLLSTGVSIEPCTPENILQAPSDQQIPLLELLTHHGWTPNNYDGALLLPKLVTNLTLLSWFLAHGTNPNLGKYRYRPGRPLRPPGPDPGSCDALESAARAGSVEAVRMLLDAGAQIKNGAPLHSAARACPPGTNPHEARVKPSKEFDESRIPVMALLVERGADVNQIEDTPYAELRIPILYAVQAGAVERVRWLLEHGADPELKGFRFNAMHYAKYSRREEMIKVVEEGLAARRWVNNGNIIKRELVIRPKPENS